jgi:hypothetical protein
MCLCLHRENALAQEDQLIQHYKQRQDEKMDDLEERNTEIRRKYKTLQHEYERLRERPMIPGARGFPGLQGPVGPQVCCRFGGAADACG